VLGRVNPRRPGSLDDPEASIRKLHAAPTPRCGGIAIACALLLGAAAAWMAGGKAGMLLALLGCAAPGFAGGLVDDFVKRASVPMRLAATAVAAALGVALLDARLTRLDIPGLDFLLAMPAVSFAVTVFAITGVAHATNVIDGLNGLAGFVSLLAALALAIVAASAGDSLVLLPACVLAASIAGFLLVNFPRGRIFLGDGGAYLVGLLLALLSVLLVHRNAAVSPWFPLLVLAYPIWETLFSMYRRKRRGRRIGRADALHLHSLVYRRVVRWRGYAGASADHVTRNSLASLLLWTLPAACFALALGFWSSSVALQASAAGFGILYTLAYWRVVRLRVPRWLVIRAKAPAEDVEAEAAEI
jgi:UDP-N-acetylmuramyl pentapeptide phosphotransferase/UDP-N-acetylglucosamine-1-phosphate transferase